MGQNVFIMVDVMMRKVKWELMGFDSLLKSGLIIRQGRGYSEDIECYMYRQSNVYNDRGCFLIVKMI